MFSAALKNIFEFVNYKETEGKTAGLTIVAGGMISFGDVQTLFTQLMSYFRVITNPTAVYSTCLLYTSPSPRDQRGSRMPSSA